MYYVYLLKDPTTNTVFYCGKGKGDRWKSHFGYWSGNGKNNPCENKIKKLRSIGIEPEVEFLYKDIADEKEAYRLEEEYIRNNFDKLVNLKIEARPPKNIGGRKQSKRTNEFKQFLSKKLKKEYNSGKRIHWTKMYSKEEVSLKISSGDPGKSKRGKPASNRKSIFCREINKTFNSLTEAAVFLGLKQGDISNVLTGRQNTTKGYSFKYS
jgi:hypothetical protein